MAAVFEIAVPVETPLDCSQQLYHLHYGSGWQAYCDRLLRSLLWDLNAPQIRLFPVAPLVPEGEAVANEVEYEVEAVSWDGAEFSLDSTSVA
jgi:hypothetical protein